MDEKSILEVGKRKQTSPANLRGNDPTKTASRSVGWWSEKMEADLRRSLKRATIDGRQRPRWVREATKMRLNRRKHS